jgi:hypothetical protein
MRQLSLDSELANLIAEKARQQERVFNDCKDNAIKVGSSIVSIEQWYWSPTPEFFRRYTDGKSAMEAGHAIHVAPSPIHSAADPSFLLDERSQPD